MEITSSRYRATWVLNSWTSILQSSRALRVVQAPSQPLPRRSESRPCGEVLLLPGKMEAAERGRFLRPLAAELMHSHPPRGAAGRGGLRSPAAPRPVPPGAAPLTAATAAGAGGDRAAERPAASPPLAAGRGGGAGAFSPPAARLSVPAEPPRRRRHAPPASCP